MRFRSSSCLSIVLDLVALVVLSIWWSARFDLSNDCQEHHQYVGPFAHFLRGHVFLDCGRCETAHWKIWQSRLSDHLHVWDQWDIMGSYPSRVRATQSWLQSCIHLYRFSLMGRQSRRGPSRLGLVRKKIGWTDESIKGCYTRTLTWPTFRVLERVRKSMAPAYSSGHGKIGADR